VYIFLVRNCIYIVESGVKHHNPNPPYLLEHFYFNYVTLMVNNIREGWTANIGSGKKRCGRRENGGRGDEN
jgi:hypothetical protein